MRLACEAVRTPMLFSQYTLFIWEDKLFLKIGLAPFKGRARGTCARIRDMGFALIAASGVARSAAPARAYATWA